MNGLTPFERTIEQTTETNAAHKIKTAANKQTIYKLTIAAKLLQQASLGLMELSFLFSKLQRESK